MNNRFLFGLLIWVVAVSLAGGSESSTDKFDVIIKGGTVYDGTGEKPRVIDVAIRADRIAGLGNFSADQAKTVIDAKGLAVAPGANEETVGGRSGISGPSFSSRVKALLMRG